MSTYGRSNHTWSKKHAKKTILNRILIWLRTHAISKSLWKNTLLAGLVCFFIGTFVFFILFVWYSRNLPDPGNLIERNIPLSTKIYDSSEKHLLYEISSGEKRTLVTLEQIPKHLKDATIVAEDRKFYQHRGIDIKGIIRATLTNIITFDLTNQGASTITQQLIKNAILTNEQTIARKVKEIILSIAIERRYTKDEILQMYLNEIPYGSTNYGAESAAHAYFDKSVNELTLAESATIAALPQAPTTYINNPDRLRDRKNWILNSMKDLNYITEEEKTEALSLDTPIKLRSIGITAPHFSLWVKEQLVSMFDERTVEEGGLRVVTTLDFNKQKIAEEVLQLRVKEQGPSLGFNNAGLIATSPKDGSILSMVGSADYFNDEIDGQVNITLRPLQPGSSFKPIIYAAAFEKGYTPNTLLWDVITAFPSNSGPYTPKNFDNKEHGLLSIRASLQGSLNIPAVKTLYLIGIENGLRFAERLGYTTFKNRSRFGLAVVLGGGEVTPIEHVAAYGTFASEGVYKPPYAIKKVFDSKGKELFSYNPSEKEKRVIDSNTARIVSDVLSDDASRAYIFGSNGSLTLPGRPVAAKTGTTNDTRDAWTAGYTPDIATVVWVGNTDGHAMKGTSGGSMAAAPIWNGFMKKALEGTSVSYFTKPTIPVTGKAVLDGTPPMETFEIDTISGLLATELTPLQFRETKTCGEYHTILSYVNPSDPLGPPPENSEKADPAWPTWESAIQSYIERLKQNPENTQIFEVCDKPLDFDNVHTLENKPNISIKSPHRGEHVSKYIKINTDVTVPRGTISKVEYLLNDTLVLTNSSTETINITVPSWVTEGNYIFTVRVYDDVDNVGEESIPIYIDLSPTP